MCSILSTRRVPNGYGYLSGMGAGKVSYPRVHVWVEFYTHWLYGYGYGIALPWPYPNPLPSLVLQVNFQIARVCLYNIKGSHILHIQTWEHVFFIKIRTFILFECFLK
jgi:hypothetical protein